MERWIEKTAVVTGASSGIGAAIVLDLVKAGVNVVGLARRKERIDALRDKIPATASGKLYAIKCDLTQETDIKNSFNWIEANLGGIDILINNAGIIKTMNLLDPQNTDNLRETIDTNVLGVVLCSREAFQSMKKRNVNGHIIHINSCAGHKIPYFVGLYPSFNIYPSTKFAVTAMTEVMRQELQSFDTKIKVTVSNTQRNSTMIEQSLFLVSLSLQMKQKQESIYDVIDFGMILFFITFSILSFLPLWHRSPTCFAIFHLNMNEWVSNIEKKKKTKFRLKLSNLLNIFSLKSISPGAVRTEIFKPEVMEIIQNIPFLDPEDVSQAVMYAIATKPHVQVILKYRKRERQRERADKKRHKQTIFFHVFIFVHRFTS